MGWSPVPVAVNISAVQLQRSDLPGTIRRLTQLHGMKPSMLQVELTESAMFENREARSGESSEDGISRLRELGVRVAIDDFGTGYSSLSYLKRWRVDYVKIDRSFVRDLVTDMSDLAIVGAIIAMARHLNIQVVAEGIEGWQQLESCGSSIAIWRRVPVREAHARLPVPPLPHRRTARPHRRRSTLRAPGRDRQLRPLNRDHPLRPHGIHRIFSRRRPPSPPVNDPNDGSTR